MVGPTGQYVRRFGFDELVGPFGVALLLFLAASFVIFLLLRPDPRDLGREISRLYAAPVSENGSGRPLALIFRQPGARVALAAMVFGQLVMVMLMVITALHMTHHQHNLSDISLVISSHTFGMFAFSILSGRLADRWGRGPVILIGALTLMLACMAAILSPEVLPLAAALFLLGLGWNFCYVGGSSLLADNLQPEERSRAQGINDLLIGLVSATGSMSSGVIFAALGYNLMGILGMLVSIIPLSMTLWWMMGRRGVRISMDSTNSR
jgi:MFS family permease